MPKPLGTSSLIIYTSALLGQFPLCKEEAEKAVTLFELEAIDALLLTIPPNRGETLLGHRPSADLPLYELVQNYGMTWKELINEEFGDGIMSAIDFNTQIEREPKPFWRPGKDLDVRRVSPL